MDLCRIKATLEQKSCNFFSLSHKRNIGQIWRKNIGYRSEYSTLKTLFHRSIIKYPKFGYSQSPEDIRLLKWRSSIICEEFASLFAKSKFSSIKVGGFGGLAITYEVNTSTEIYITLYKSTLIHWFDWRFLWLSSMRTRSGDLPFFCEIHKWKINIILGLGHKSCQTIKAQYHAHFGYPNAPTKFDLRRKINVGRCNVTRL